MPAHRKPAPDVETLRRLYLDEMRSSHEIARMFGCNGGNVARRWLREAGIEIRPHGWSLKPGIHSAAQEEALRASRRGERSHWWRGGVSPEAMRFRASKEWLQIRASVYARDNWTCQECGCKCLNTRASKNHPKRKIQCHHIIPRRNGGPDEPDNLTTLCMSCHHKIERRTDPKRS